MAIVGLAIVVLVVVIWWAISRVRTSTRSDIKFLIRGLVLVIALAMLVLVADVLYGRYCIVEYSEKYYRARFTNQFMALVVAELIVLFGGCAITLYRWNRRIAGRREHANS
jgi:hypothetical protein